MLRLVVMFRMTKVLVIAPIIGFIGNAVNERQVVMALSRYSEHVFVITPLDIKSIVKGLYKKYLEQRPPNVRVFLVPLLAFKRFWVTRHIIYTFYALLFSIIAYILDLREGFDLIYVRDPHFAIFISFSKRLSRKAFVKIGAIAEEDIHVYTRLLKRLAIAVMQSIDRHVMKHVAGIVVASVDFAKHLVLRRQVLPEKIRILPPGIMWSTINTVKRYCPRRKRGIMDEVVVGFLGFLEVWQGVDILCDIVAELSKKGYRAKLKVIGDGPLRKYLINRCIDKGVEVEITGFLPHHKALCLARRDFDILVLPRIRSETTSSIVPIKVIEALALGIPVVVTELSAYRELEGKGLYTSKRTPKHFADTILKLLSSMQYCVDYEFLQKYSYEYNVDKFIKMSLNSKYR